MELLRHGSRNWDAYIQLPDEKLLAIAAPDRRLRLGLAWEEFDPAAARARVRAARLQSICRHDPAYPSRLEDLPAPPPVLYVAASDATFGAALGRPALAIVGARRPTDYGLEVSRSLAAGAAGAGATVVSGMALGVDSAAHRGALDVGGTTVAVLAGAAEKAYPAVNRALYSQVQASGLVISESAPGVSARRWSFLARNRIVAALSDAVIVVEAGERSGSLVTADLASQLGRPVGAVPGRVTSPLSCGTLRLLRDGAELIRDGADALDLLGGFGVAASSLQGRPVAPRLCDELEALLAAVAGGTDTVEALAASGWAGEAATVGLAELELLDRVRRGRGGRYTVVPKPGWQTSMF